MPEQKKPRGNAKSEPLSWDKVVAKLLIRGLSPEQIGRMTRYQVFAAINEMNDERQEEYRIAGWKSAEEDGEGDKEATLQDLLGFM